MRTEAEIREELRLAHERMMNFIKTGRSHNADMASSYISALEWVLFVEEEEAE